MLLLISEMLAGDSSNQATCMVQQDQPEKADADANIISVEGGKISNFGDQVISFTLTKSDQF